MPLVPMVLPGGVLEITIISPILFMFLLGLKVEFTTDV